MIPEEQILDLIEDSQHTIDEIKKMINLFRPNESIDDLKKVMVIIEEKNKQLLQCKKYKEVKKILKVKKVAKRVGFKTDLLSDLDKVRRY